MVTCTHAAVQRRVAAGEYNRGNFQNTNKKILQPVPSLLLLRLISLGSTNVVLATSSKLLERQTRVFQAWSHDPSLYRDTFYIRSPMLFLLYIPYVATFWSPLGLPLHNLSSSSPQNSSPRTRSVYILRPTAEVLIQGTILNQLICDGNCPCPTYVTTRAHVVTLTVLWVIRSHAALILSLSLSVLTWIFFCDSFHNEEHEKAWQYIRCTCVAD
jgi:hypothetical protein